MLVLTRKPGEAVDLHDTRTNQPVGTVTVLAILAGGVVRLGFDAEPHIRILRDNVKPTTEKDHGDEEDDDDKGNRA
jgi:carbon storage regulator CsrA